MNIVDKYQYIVAGYDRLWAIAPESVGARFVSDVKYLVFLKYHIPYAHCMSDNTFLYCECDVPVILSDDEIAYVDSLYERIQKHPLLIG